MEKSFELIVEDFKTELYNLVNGSNISPYFLEPIFKDIYIEIRDAAQEQIKAQREELAQKQAESQNTTEPDSEVEELKGDLGVEMPFMNNMPTPEPVADVEKSEN